MKNIIKSFGFHIVLGTCTLASLGIVYAAWNDDVTSSDTLTTDRWNDLVTQVEGITSGSGQFIGGTNPNDAVFTSGNVGIGTTSPTQRLHLSGDSYEKLLIETTEDTLGFAQVAFKSPSQEWSLGAHQDDSFRLYNNTLGQTSLFIDQSSGNVGIGTSTPTGKLHFDIDATDSTGQAIIVDSENQYGPIGINNYGTGHPVYVGARAGGTQESPSTLPAFYSTNVLLGSAYANGQFNQVGRVSILSGDNFSDANPTDGQIAFFAGGGGNDMIIKNDGNVGIGTNSPQAKLHVRNGSGDSVISADGTVQSRLNLFSDATGTGKQWHITNEANVGRLRFSVADDRSDSNFQTNMILTDNGNVTINALSGSGNGYACIDASGTLYRSTTACN